jgi:hypothetical protein
MRAQTHVIYREGVPGSEFYMIFPVRGLPRLLVFS